MKEIQATHEEQFLQVHSAPLIWLQEPMNPWSAVNRAASLAGINLNNLAIDAVINIFKHSGHRPVKLLVSTWTMEKLNRRFGKPICVYNGIKVEEAPSFDPGWFEVVL